MMAIDNDISAQQLLGGRNRTPVQQSGFFDPQTGAPISVTEIGNYTFVKDAQGVFRQVTVNSDDPFGEQFYEFPIADIGTLRDYGFLPKEGGGGAGGGAPAYSSTRQAQIEAQTFQ